MDTNSKSFHLRVEREGSADTLEAVLAVVRRGGVRLHSLRMSPGRHGVELHLRVHADADALHLCKARLVQLIGIVKLRVLEDGREPFRPRDAAHSYGSAPRGVPSSGHDQDKRRAS